MGDGAPKAEEASGEGIEMDRIDVARNSGVAAADISRDPPYRGRRPPPRPSPARGGGRGGLTGGGSGPGGRPPAEGGIQFGPDRVRLPGPLSRRGDMRAS